MLTVTAARLTFTFNNKSNNNSNNKAMACSLPLPLDTLSLFRSPHIPTPNPLAFSRLLPTSNPTSIRIIR